MINQMSDVIVSFCTNEGYSLKLKCGIFFFFIFIAVLYAEPKVHVLFVKNFSS